MIPELVAVAIPAPLHKLFDYQVPDALRGRLRTGMRLRVPFGRRSVVGVVAQPPRAAPDAGANNGAEYRLIEALLDAEPALPDDLVNLCRWAAGYYQHPPGEVFALALPAPWRRGESVALDVERWLALTPEGEAALATIPAAHRMLRELLAALAAGPQAESALTISAATRRRALERGWVAVQSPPAVPTLNEEPPRLTAEQSAVLEPLRAGLGRFGVNLLEGVTGSGKTEVYLRLIGAALEQGGQALVLVPEIGLTPQLAERFARRFGRAVGSFHSGLSERERVQTWLRARAGALRVVVGTRSAVWLPFRELKLVVIDEEHDVSYKQQDGFRYSARDVAMLRAHRQGIPVVLGTATPSLETLHRARSGRYRHLQLRSRVTAGAPPTVRLIDVRHQTLTHGLSPSLLQAIERQLAAGNQCLLFINRRGYAPVLLCGACGWTAPCTNCNAKLTLHRASGRLICHHCGAREAPPRACPSCGARELTALGQGTERIEDALRNQFPRHRVERFDSDRLGRAGELERLLAAIHAREIHILVGTQILAKGHDFDGLALVGIVSVDQALYGTDFRALERMGQLVTQVAGRAGRSGQPAEVWLQTFDPQHPLLRTLVEGGYPALCDALLEERRLAGLPPYAHLALLRAEAREPETALAFLRLVRGLAHSDSGDTGDVMVSDAVPAPMEKRGGMFRAQLLLQAAQRPALHQLLARLVPLAGALREARTVRWSVDVDPADLF